MLSASSFGLFRPHRQNYCKQRSSPGGLTGFSVIDSIPRFGPDAVAIAIRRDFVWLISTRSRDGIPGETRRTGASSAPACADPEDPGPTSGRGGYPGTT